mmetsp:Transcript_58870/g.125051  ORF Transcript_58870/g.125051 Transcript_58870/m.125051 type:complete len:168 (+) Transcript_58870:450-953(+)
MGLGLFCAVISSCFVEQRKLGQVEEKVLLRGVCDCASVDGDKQRKIYATSNNFILRDLPETPTHQRKIKQHHPPEIFPKLPPTNARSMRHQASKIVLRYIPKTSTHQPRDNFPEQRVIEPTNTTRQFSRAEGLPCKHHATIIPSDITVRKSFQMCTLGSSVGQPPKT